MSRDLIVGRVALLAVGQRGPTSVRAGRLGTSALY